MTRCAGCPRCSCTIISTGVCDRPTVADLADDIGYDPLPASDTAGLVEWFHGVAGAAGSLERYLEAFDHTVAVMQTESALVRVARECAEDLAADGVVYAEVRFAPELHVAELEPAGGRRGGCSRASVKDPRAPA